MPDQELESLLLKRPVKVSGEVQYPTEQADKGPVRNFLAGVMGTDEQIPGNVASGLGTMAGMALPMGAGKLGELGKDEKLAMSLFDRAIDEGTLHSRPRALRLEDAKKVEATYQNLADRGLVAWPDELQKLRDSVKGLKVDGGIKPIPTGIDVPDHQVNIINRLAQIGYTPSEEEVSVLSELLRHASMVTGRIDKMKGTGDYARFVGSRLPLRDPLRAALKKVPNWADGQTIKQLKSK